MLPAIIAWSLNNRYVVLGLAGVVAIAGFISLSRLNIDAFPDTTPIQVQINTAAPALVPEEVERQITFPVELAMSGMPGLEQLRSISQFGLSQVVVTFKDGTDIYFARQLINERLSTVEMPTGIGRPEMGPVSTGLGEVFHFLVIGEGQTLTEARTTLDWTVRPELRAVPGTAEVNTWGGLKKQYQVRVDPQRLIEYDLSFDQVMNAVRENNLNVGGGNINRSGDMLLVHGVGRTSDVPQIENMVITAKDGLPVRIRDVAEVAIGHEIRRGAVTANGEGEVVLGLSFMLMGENSYGVTTRQREKFEEVQKTLPKGVRMEAVYDRTVLVDRVIDTVRKNLLEGAFLVVLLLFVFLGNLRAGLICAAAIPLSMLFGFCGMLQAGIAGSLLSLGAIDFGIVVDSSVVVVENAVAKLAHHGPVSGQLRRDIVRDAAIEVRTPTVFGQLIIMIVYIPILTLQGVEGKMFRPMALTVVFVLIGSLIMSLTLIPVLASMFLPKRLEEKDVLVVRAAKWLYAPVLRVALNFRWAVLGFAAAMLFLAFQIAMNFGSEFVPRLSEGDVVIGIVRAPGTALEESIRINTDMERMLMKSFPDEISHIWARQGAPEVATDAGSIETTDMFISLKPRELWKKAPTQSDLVVLMDQVVGDIPGQTIWFTQPIEQRINEMISGVRADVALKLFAGDFDKLIYKARELENVLRKIPGAADISTEQLAGQPILRITIKQDEIARYGVPAETVLDLVESVGGKALGEIIEGQLRIPLVVRVSEDARSSPEAIANILVPAPSGEQIPLSRLADVRVIEGPKLISREFGKRRITVQANVRGRDVGSFVAEAQKKIAEAVDLPPDTYRIEWGGQFENMQRAQQRLTIVVPLALAMIVGLLYLTYRNVVDTLVVFSSVPFACVGGILAMQGRAMPLSVSAAVGFITLSGVSVLSSMVLISFIRQSMAAGMSLRDAIQHSCVACLRTILMTSLVASVGFIPMATSTGTGAEVQRPLATVVIGGVISATLMTLIVLPALYSIVGGWGRRPRPAGPIEATGHGFAAAH